MNDKQIAAIIGTVRKLLGEIKLSEKGSPKRVRLMLSYDGGTVDCETVVEEINENEVKAK
jgi:hypothetical protein